MDGLRLSTALNGPVFPQLPLSGRARNIVKMGVGCGGGVSSLVAVFRRQDGGERCKLEYRNEVRRRELLEPRPHPLPPSPPPLGNWSQIAVCSVQ